MAWPLVAKPEWFGAGGGGGTWTESSDTASDLPAAEYAWEPPESPALLSVPIPRGAPAPVTTDDAAPLCALRTRNGFCPRM
mmetsp:Transcript_10745/g.16118  ORF Transcript_10745/g.16118 Transcript_10745/m.16118 type:complete len:81 (-) Transcript_10745:239-481(-)